MHKNWLLNTRHCYIKSNNYNFKERCRVTKIFLVNVLQSELINYFSQLIPLNQLDFIITPFWKLYNFSKWKCRKNIKCFVHMCTQRMILEGLFPFLYVKQIDCDLDLTIPTEQLVATDSSRFKFFEIFTMATVLVEIRFLMKKYIRNEVDTDKLFPGNREGANGHSCVYVCFLFPHKLVVFLSSTKSDVRLPFT